MTSYMISVTRVTFCKFASYNFIGKTCLKSSG